MLKRLFALLLLAGIGVAGLHVFQHFRTRPDIPRTDETNGTPEKSAESGPLLGTHWDFADRSLPGWRHKENAEIAVAEEDGQAALRLRSDFARQPFTWAARHFRPRSLDGVRHVTFRVRGDGSGHRLEVHLGAPAAAASRYLYYVNSRQTVALDFTDWRTVSLDVEQFVTPHNGLRSRDLARVVFLEFTVHAKAAQTKASAAGADDEKASEAKPSPVDIALADIQFAGYTPEELAAQQEAGQQRASLIATGAEQLKRIRTELDRRRDEIDARAAEGKHVERARVYWTAADWCARDAARWLAADELNLVRRATTMLAELEQCAADRSRYEKQILDATPDEPNTLHWPDNPFYLTMIRRARLLSRGERWWPKGEAGYRSVSDAWSFRTLGEEAYTAVWALTRPRSQLRHHPVLTANALNLLEAISRLHAEGDFNLDRAAIHGYDGNINRFCLAPALDAWCELSAAYPDLLPLAWKDSIESGYKQLVEYQVRDYGMDAPARRGQSEPRVYPNMDVHYILIMELAGRLWKDPRYANEREEFLAMVASAVRPMGSLAYIASQNDCFVYHQLDVAYLARYWKISGDQRVLKLLKSTVPYYPRMVEPAGMPEHYTDPSWKHYWGAGEPQGPAIIAALFDDPQNQQVAETCAAVSGYGRGYATLVAADFWKPIHAAPQADNYVMYDADVEGPRGRFGVWSFAGNGRDYGSGQRGKDTLVGAMITDAAARPLPLNAALMAVNAEVDLELPGSTGQSARYHAAHEKLGKTLGPDFGALAVRYAVSRPTSAAANAPRSWLGVQTWYLSKTRLIGLVELECTAEESRAAVRGRLRFGLSRQLEGSEDEWSYGRMKVHVRSHNFGQIVARTVETGQREQAVAERCSELTLLDPPLDADGQSHTAVHKKGKRYRFLVDIHPDTSSPAEDVQRVDRPPATGFRFREADREVLVLFNDSPAPVTAKLPEDPAWQKAIVYGDAKTSKGEAASSSVRLGGYGQAVVVRHIPPRP